MAAAAHLAQVNNQPPLLGQVSLACEVLLNTTAAGGTALEALSAVSRYFRDSYSNAGCWEWDYNPKTTLVPGAGKPGYHSYVYQCCTEGVAHSGMLPAIASDRTLNPEDLPVHPKDFQAQCRWVQAVPCCLDLREPGSIHAFMLPGVLTGPGIGSGSKLEHNNAQCLSYDYNTASLLPAVIDS